ncbi:hypothetical protein Peur_006313 [Populus x canadensis]
MAGTREITAATEFLLGNNRKTLYVQRDLPINRRNQLLFGMLRGHRAAFGVSNKRSVSLRCRAQSKPRALVSGGVTSSVDEQSCLIEKPAQELIHFYRIPLIQESATLELLKSVQTKVSNKIVGLRTEQCFNIGIRSGISSQKLGVLRWLLQETYEPENLGTENFLEKKMKEGVNAVIVEAGPRLFLTTAWSANAVSICHACGLTEVTRLERSRRYLLYSKGVMQDYQINEFAAMVHDRMTECVYTQKLTSFETSVVPEEVRYVPVMERGRKALEEINQEMGLAFDEQDLQYYTSLFREDIKRNPTTVELFDIAQSNSEHSWHWFFTGKIIIDGQPMNRTLMQIVKSTLQANPNNSVISFKDSSSAIKGFPVKQLRPVQPGSTCPLNASNRDLDILFTAETHNFPFLIDASNGASDYGNKFGEPLIQGYTRTFGMRLPSGERREWLKPIMFSGGIGQIDHTHITKWEPDVGMLVVKIGGPAYRIGMGGGAASSMVSGQNDADLDFNAVQRGDAGMAQKLYRVVRSCIEMGENNPIISIHDQGAGVNCNVVKEIIYPKGAQIDIQAIVVGDHTMSVLEIWGAEYQEQDAILVKAESRDLLQSICKRERVSMAVIGTISGEGRVVLVDSSAIEKCRSNGLPPPPPAVDLELEKVLGDMPQKSFEFHRVVSAREPLDIAPDITVRDALMRVLRLPSVCSKRFLTTKVDRCVTGLVAQQQTVGPLQITLADVAVIAQTYTDLTGGACAIGEQPIKGLVNPKAMARLAVGEALTNLV